MVDSFSLLALLAFPVYLLLRKDKRFPAGRFPQVACSWSCLLALSLCALCSSPEYSVFVSSCAGFAVSPLVMAKMLPSRLPFMIAAGMASVLAVAVRLLCPRYVELGSLAWIFTLLVLATAAVAVHYDLKGRSKANALPRKMLSRSKNDAEVSLLLILVTAFLVALSSSSGPGGRPAGILLSPLCLMVHTAIFVLRSVETLSGKRYLYKETGQDLSCGIVSLCRDSAQDDGEDRSYMEIYDRLVKYFEEERPYLNADVNIADVAKNIFTNKVYISKAVSACTGRNFCQFVNYYRIRYTVNLFISDPTLKVSQLARMSGFNILPTFNLAFRLYMNESPRDWCRRYVLEHGLAEEKSDGELKDV
ncbi:MAG: helix-turn-helix domain-containing protein [Candidatus Cryptobacteroides sp.]